MLAGDHTRHRAVAGRALQSEHLPRCQRGRRRTRAGALERVRDDGRRRHFSGRGRRRDVANRLRLALRGHRAMQPAPGPEVNGASFLRGSAGGARHPPAVDRVRGRGQSLARLTRVVETARECGFAAVSANDHFLFQTPWLDGLTALAAVLDRSGEMELATTVSLVALRGPVPLAKTLAALDVLSDGRVIAGIGPGSSARDYDAVGIPYEERWERFDEATAILRALLRDEAPPEIRRHYSLPDSPLTPAPRRAGGIPLWIGSWGSKAGLRRVARLGDGWLASAYNTTPTGFEAAHDRCRGELSARGRDPDRFPNALATMWTWITPHRREADRVLQDVLGPLLKRDPDDLREQLCVGSAEECAELLSRYAQAGCKRVHLWPVGDEPAQIELAATAVLPAVVN